MHENVIHSPAVGEPFQDETHFESSVSSADLADRCQAILVALDRTGLGIGVEPAYLVGLREGLTCATVRLASRPPAGLGELRRFEHLVARSAGFVDDWTFAFLQMMVRRHTREVGLLAGRLARGVDAAEEARETAALEGAIAVCARKRRDAAPHRRT